MPDDWLGNGKDDCAVVFFRDAIQNLNCDKCEMDYSQISVFVRFWFCLWRYNLQIFEGHWCWTEVHLIRAFPGNHSSLVASMFMVIDHGQSWSSSLLLVSIDSPSHRRPPSWESIITLPPPPQSQCSDATHLPHHYILSANVKETSSPSLKTLPLSPSGFREFS